MSNGTIRCPFRESYSAIRRGSTQCACFKRCFAVRAPGTAAICFDVVTGLLGFLAAFVRLSGDTLERLAVFLHVLLAFG